MRQDLPSGTITFLFTDVQGSTKLLHEVGDERYASILAEHHRLCREAWRAHRGVEVDTEGDAFFVVFEGAAEALRAAQAAQQALADGPVSVRMGLHTGQVLVRETGYIGRELHLAARIASAGHGGQVILSHQTRQQAGDGFVFRDLGEHRLKDIDDPVVIFQLGDGRHPPLRTISNTNLPRPASTFVGRERELAEVIGKFEQGARLVTLTGPGGTGKTRLALEAAASMVGAYPAGVFWLGLSALRDASLVTATIAQTLGAKEGLAEHIGQRVMLLFLDNLEQVIGCAPELSDLLERCPGLSVLVTSRQVLRVRGEVEYAVPPLTEAAAMALFCERSQLQTSSEIRELCTRLDHLPLAVELAAARAKALSPKQILQRLSQRLDLLRGGRDSDPRQHTLRSTIEWSYELLDGDEQALFGRLAVFAGGCTLEAAETICDAQLDTLQSLVEKSLVRYSNERYWMLETIREYARDRLDVAGETNEIGRVHATRHARLALDLAEPLRDRSPDAIARLRDEYDNMREALGFALDRGDVVTTSDLLTGLWFFWLISGRAGEGAAWVRRYLALPRQNTPPFERFTGDDGASEILRFTGDPETATQLKIELVATGLARPDAVVNGVALGGSIAGTLSDLAWMELNAGRIESAQSYADQALALRRESGRARGIAHAMLAVAGIAFRQGDYGRARDVFVAAAALYESAEIDTDWAECCVNVAQCELLLGHHQRATASLRDAFPAVSVLSDGIMDVVALRVAGMIAADSGQAATCVAIFGAADRMLRDSDVRQFDDHEETVHRAFLDRARAAIGEAAFAEASEQGRAATRDEIMAVAFAALA